MCKQHTKSNNDEIQVTITKMSADIGKENGVVPRTPRGQVKKAVGASGAASRVRRLPLASKDSNRSTMNGLGGIKNTTKGALHLKKYGSILYQGQQGLGNTNANANSGLPRVKSLVLKDLDSGRDRSESDSDSDDMGILSKLRGLSEEPDQPLTAGPGLFGGRGLEALLEQEDDKKIESAPLPQKELPYIPDGIEPLDVNDIIRLDNAPLVHPHLQDTADISDNESIQLLPLEVLSTTPDGVTLPTVHRQDHSLRTQLPGSPDDLALDLALATPIDEQYNGLGLDDDDLADLLR